MRRVFRRIKKGIRHYRERKSGSNSRGKNILAFQKFKRDNNAKG